jgi:hypothetical protein
MDYGTYMAAKWTVEIGDEFQPECDALHEEVQDDFLAMARLLQQFGPQLKRPHADTMFDRRRTAVLLVAGDKSGTSEKRFYREFIEKADDRYDAHLSRQKKKERK